MSTNHSPTMRFYKICALIGTLIIISDIVISWSRIQAFEKNVTDVFESMVTNQMEFDGLQQDFSHINKVLQQAKELKADKAVQVDGIDYSAYEVERLRNEQSNIRLYMQEKQLVFCF